MTAKRDLIKLINEGHSLPEKYRFILFEDKREVELVWNGKSRDGINFGGSSDNTHTLTVTKAATITAAENAATAIPQANTTIFLNTNVTSRAGIVGEGTVSFQLKNDAGNNLGSAVTAAVIGGVAAAATVGGYALPPGTPPGSYSIEAIFSGSANFETSSDNTHTLTITQIATSTAIVPSVNPSVYGQAVTFTATIAPNAGGGVPTGTVTFLQNGAPLPGGSDLALDLRGAATFTTATLSAGNHNIVASYNGNSNFAPSDSLTIVQTVQTVNSAPVALNGTLTTAEDTPTTGTLVIGDVDDADNGILIFSIVSGPSKGKVEITNAATGAFTYTPGPDANGSDSFSFKGNDGTVDSNTATFTITVTSVNDQPATQNLSFATLDSKPDRERPSLSGNSQAILSRCVATSGGKNDRTARPGQVVPSRDSFLIEPRDPKPYGLSRQVQFTSDLPNALPVGKSQEDANALRLPIGSAGAAQPMFESGAFERRQVETEGRAKHKRLQNSPTDILSSTCFIALIQNG